jgi:hypothetical protein
LLPFTNKPGSERSAESTGLPEECIVLWRISYFVYHYCLCFAWGVDGYNDYRFCLTSCFKLYFYTKCPDGFSWIHRSDTKLSKQGYVSPRLKSSLQTLYRRHHDLVDRYEIFISQMIMNLVHFAHIFYFLYHRSNPIWMHFTELFATTFVFATKLFGINTWRFWWAPFCSSF